MNGFINELSMDWMIKRCIAEETTTNLLHVEKLEQKKKKNNVKTTTSKNENKPTTINSKQLELLLIQGKQSSREHR